MENFSNKSENKEDKILKFKKILEQIKIRSQKDKVTAEIKNLKKQIDASSITLGEIGIDEKELKEIEANGYIARAKEWHDLALTIMQENDTNIISEDEAVLIYSCAEEISLLLSKNITKVLEDDIGTSNEISKQILKIVEEGEK